MSFWDYAIPVAATGGTYFLIRKNEKINMTQKIGISIGAGALAFLIKRTVGSYKGQVQKAPVDYGQIPYVYDSAGRPVKWDPDPLAKEIFENIEGWNVFTYPETTDKISALQPEQVKLLYNHYNQYYAEEFPTLTKLIAAEWPQTPAAATSYTKAVAKLKSLGLNERAW